MNAIFATEILRSLVAAFKSHFDSGDAGHQINLTGASFQWNMGQ